MSKVVNLNQFRKRKARETAAALAAENRVKFGRTKAQKQQDALAQAEAERRLALLKLDTQEDPEAPKGPADRKGEDAS